MRNSWPFLTVSLVALGVGGCSGSTGADAGAQPDAAGTGTCPNVAETYTYLTEPSVDCPSVKSTVRRAVRVAQPAGSCEVTFDSTTTAENRWPMAATVTIDGAGAFTDASFTIASQPTTCSGVYVPGAPSRYDVTCAGGCTFSIRVGE